jgi:hypothetical protein
MRRYRIDNQDNEQPVWASKARLTALGETEGRAAAKEGRQPIRMSNPTHDNAARLAFEAAGGILSPEWFPL